MADYKKDPRPQREKFEELAKELEANSVDADKLDKLIGSVGKHKPTTEAEAREAEGKPPARR
jgi:hypothetical protein